MPLLARLLQAAHVVGQAGKPLEATFVIEQSVDAPLRVPIARPSSGVRPMLVSRLWPLTMAQVEQPLPRWADNQLLVAGSRPLSSAARWLT